MLSSSCHLLNTLKRRLIAGFVATVLSMGLGLTVKADTRCHNGPIFAFSQAVYVSDFARAQKLIAEIRRERSTEMADFLQQVLIYTRGYEAGQAQDQEAALSEIDALIERLSGRLTSDSSLRSRLDAGNIMMNAARLHLLSRNVMDSAQLAKAAHVLLDEILDENPEQTEAYLSVGLYQYFAANENNAWGWVKRLLALQGDKERGRELIELAVKASDDFAFEAARSLMMDLAWNHPDVCRYVELFDQLDAPELETIEHRQRHIAARLFCGHPELADIELQETKTLIDQRALLASRAQLQWLLEAELQSMAMQGQSGVLRELLASESKDHAEKAMIIRFSLARALDVTGAHVRAKQYYAQVEASTVAGRYQRLAVSYQQQPYRAPRPTVLQENDRIQFVCKGGADQLGSVPESLQSR